MSATAAQADAAAFSRGGFGVVPGAGNFVAFDALAQFNFAGVAGGGAAGDSVALPFGEESAVPEPGTLLLITIGVTGLALPKRFGHAAG